MDESRRAEIPIVDEDRQEAERLAREEAEALFADEEEELALLMRGDEPEDEFAARFSRIICFGRSRQVSFKPPFKGYRAAKRTQANLVLISD